MVDIGVDDHKVRHDAPRFAGRSDLLVIVEGGDDTQAADDADACF